MSLKVDTVAAGVVVPGSVATVTFPKDQVDQLRRDVGKVYRIRAYGPAERLTAELTGFDHPCGDTKLASE